MAPNPTPEIQRRPTDYTATEQTEIDPHENNRQENLAEAHAESERLLAAISSLLIGVDASGAIKRWNDSATEILGITPAEAIGKQFVELDIDWENRNEFVAFFESVQSNASARIELTFLDATGTSRIVGLSAYPIGADFEPKGTLVLGADLTKKKVIEYQLQQAQKLEAVGQLAAGVAHEINTPMQYLGDNIDYLQNKIRMLAPLLEKYEAVLEIARRSGENESLILDLQEKLKKLKVKSFLKQASEAIDDSSDGVKHVSRIVRAMKEFSHPGQDEKTTLDVNYALESAVAVATNEWKYVADMQFNLDPSIPLIPAFPGEVNQVFLNILVNAAHAIADANENGALGKGTINISTHCTDTHVQVAIRDSGTGIPDDIRQRIFDPFFTTKAIGKGTGQGLSIAYSVVVQKHGGTLVCDSKLGEGTTFSIALPIDDCHVEEDVAPALASSER